MSLQIAAVTLEYRSPARTLACVAALLADGVSSVLILDNSDDGGKTERRLRDALSEEGRVRIVSGGGNLGFAAGVNAALRVLRDDGWDGRVLLINNDALVRPAAVLALDEALDGHPDAALAYPSIDHGGQSLTLTYYHPATGRLSHADAFGGLPYVSGCCILLAREVVRERLFDDTFFMYGEDVELSFRLGRIGYRLVHAPGAYVLHEGSASSGMNTLFYEMHMVAAHVILASRLADSPLQRAGYIAGRCLFLPLRAIVRAFRYRSSTPLLGLVRGWSLGRRALRTHRASNVTSAHV